MKQYRALIIHPANKCAPYTKGSRMRILLAFLALAVLSSTSANTQPVFHPERGSPLRSTILDAARPIFESQTSGPIEFVVDRLSVTGSWAFGAVRLRRPGGKSIDWRKTQFATQLAEGAFDPPGAFFLLRRQAGRWDIVAYAIGPTDVAWESWRVDYKLPRDLFD